jgi:acyl carrier protein
MARERYWVSESASSAAASPARTNGHADAGNGASAAAGHAPGATDPTSATDAVRDYIVERLISELGIAPARIQLNRKLHELGIDSLMGRRLLRSLEEAFSIRVSGKQLLENPTIAGLAALTARMMPKNGEATSPSTHKPQASFANGSHDGGLDPERLIALIEQGSIL